MNFSGFLTVGYFLFNVVVGLISFALWGRIALRYFYVSSLHPFSMIINRYTEPMLAPVNRFLKLRQSRAHRLDYAAFIALILLEIIKFFFVGPLLIKSMLPVWLIIVYSVADLIIQPCDLLFYAVLIRVMLSWVMPVTNNPLADALYLITEPLLSRARRLLPSTTGIDFSPFLLLIVLKSVALFINASLPLHLL